jgi:hypothetical protein
MATMVATAGRVNARDCQFTIVPTTVPLVWAPGFDADGPAIATCRVKLVPIDHPAPRSPLLAEVKRLIGTDSWLHVLHLPRGDFWPERACVELGGKTALAPRFTELTPSRGVPFTVLEGQALFDMVLHVAMYWAELEPHLN